MFFVLLIGLPFAADAVPSQALKLFDAFYRAGSLVFGGGHVVLPLLQASVVPPGWVSNDAFLAGYGAAQALPGPLFTFAAYLGTVMKPAAQRLGRRRALSGRDFPAVVLPGGRRAAVLGSLAPAAAGASGAARGQCGGGRACCWPRSIARCGPRRSRGPADFALAAAGFLLLFMWKVPPWLVVLLSALGGWLIGG